MALDFINVLLYWPLILLLLYPLTYLLAIIDGIINLLQKKSGENFSSEQYQEQSTYYPPTTTGSKGSSFTSQVMWLEQEG